MGVSDVDHTTTTLSRHRRNGKADLLICRWLVCCKRLVTQQCGCKNRAIGRMLSRNPVITGYLYSKTPRPRQRLNPIVAAVTCLSIVNAKTDICRETSLDLGTVPIVYNEDDGVEGIRHTRHNFWGSIC